MTSSTQPEARWELGALRERLSEELSDMLPGRGPLRLDFLCNPKAVADDATKLLVRDRHGRRAAVVLISSPVETGLISRGIQRAQAIKARLGPTLGRVILEPIGTGTLDSCSYAVLPYCKPMSKGRIGKRIHRAMLRPIVLEWLARIAETTAQTPGVEQTQRGFIVPLESLAANPVMSEPLRQAARGALGRLKDGEWTPRHTVMHGDLWEGNILFSGPQNRDPGNPFSRIAVIDWPGGSIEGYPFYDLLRLARSMSLPKHTLCNQLGRHCRALGCGPDGARDHLLAALGHLGMHLGHFPSERYSRLSAQCLALLNHALNG